MENARMRFSDLVVARLSTVTGVLVFLAASSLPFIAPASQGVGTEAALAFALAGDTARANPWPRTWVNASRWTARFNRFGCLLFGHKL